MVRVQARPRAPCCCDEEGRQWARASVGAARGTGTGSVGGLSVRGLASVLRLSVGRPGSCLCWVGQGSNPQWIGRSSRFLLRLGRAGVLHQSVGRSVIQARASVGSVRGLAFVSRSVGHAGSCPSPVGQGSCIRQPVCNPVSSMSPVGLRNGCGTGGSWQQSCNKQEATLIGAAVV